MNIPRELLALLQVLLSVSAAAAGHGRPVPPVTRSACLCIRLHQMMSKGWKKTKCLLKGVGPSGPQKRSREAQLGFPAGTVSLSFARLPVVRPATLSVTVYFPV